MTILITIAAFIATVFCGYKIMKIQDENYHNSQREWWENPNDKSDISW